MAYTGAVYVNPSDSLCGQYICVQSCPESAEIIVLCNPDPAIEKASIGLNAIQRLNLMSRVRSHVCCTVFPAATTLSDATRLVVRVTDHVPPLNWPLDLRVSPQPIAISNDAHTTLKQTATDMYTLQRRTWDVKIGNAIHAHLVHRVVDTGYLWPVKWLLPDGKSRTAVLLVLAVETDGVSIDRHTAARIGLNTRIDFVEPLNY